MSRRCIVTGKGVMFGNNVSHANNKTRRRFTPNIQDISLFSEKLGKSVSMRISTQGLRTIEKKGGIDAWLLSVKAAELPADLRSLRRQIEAKTAQAA